MISVTHFMAAYAIGSVSWLGKNESSAAGVLPDIDVLFSFMYPFSHRGITHTLGFGLFAGLIYAYLTGDRRSGFSVIAGWLTHLSLDSLTSSGVPWFFPFQGSIGLSVTYASDPYWNLSLISASVAAILFFNHSEIFKPLLNRS